MNSLTAKKRNKDKIWLEEVSERVAKVLMDKMDLKRTDYLKIKLGIEVSLINLTKGIIVYGIAALLGSLVPTLITHISYVVLRRVAYGLHAEKFINCALLSVLLFALFPYSVRNFTISNGELIIFFLVSLFLIYRYAPADTEKNPLIGIEKRLKLRNKSLLAGVILMFIALIISNPTINIMVVLGVSLQVVSILPITYKLLKRGYNNYEKHGN